MRWMLVIATLLAGCASRPTSNVGSSRVFVRVLDQSKKPLADAGIASNGNVVAQTNADGLAEITVTGGDGATFAVEVRCPSTHRSPASPILVRRVAFGAAPEYVTRCEKLRHSLVIAVRAEGAGNMPVIHLGKEIARTDASGSAHVLIEAEVHGRVELTLDTRDPKFKGMHPQSPVFSTEVTGFDDVRVFDVKFTRDKKPVARAAPKTAPKQL